MKEKITLVTLGVDDLKRSLEFYRALGFQSDGIVGGEDAEGGVVFFKLENMRFALWERKSIAKDTGLPYEPDPSLRLRSGQAEFTLAINVSSKEEVDAAMAEAAKAGAHILKPAAEAFWGGYTGYFQDPDGHVWEIAWNPMWEEEDKQ
jgi:catechol 2,3-dioxygenase-like lactoylglutathione lyase family enzyme